MRFVVLGTCGLLLACTETKLPPPTPDTGPPPPPLVCKTPSALGAGPYFTEVTDQVGFGFASVNEIVPDLKALYGTSKTIPDDLWAISVGVSAADLNGDGLPELVVNVRPSAEPLRDPMKQDDPHLLRRLLVAQKTDGFPTYADTTRTSGLVTATSGQGGRAFGGAIFGDVDNDGDTDVLTVQGADPTSEDRTDILLNDGTGKLTLAPRSGLAQNAEGQGSATFLDYDLDGVLDVYMGYNYKNEPFAYQDRLFHGNGDGTFDDVTDAMGLTTYATYPSFDNDTNSKPTFGVTSCDIDRDGDPDILSSSYGRQFNMLWRNDSDKFSEIGRDTAFASDDGVDYTDNQFYRCFCQGGGGCTAPAPVISCPSPANWTMDWDDKPHRLGGNTFSTVCADLDDDGKLDVMSAEIRHFWAGSSSDASRPLFQEAGGAAGFHFVRPDLTACGVVQPHVGSGWDEGNIRLAVLDFDNDGHKDIYLGTSDYPNTFGLLFRNKQNRVFEEISTTAGVKVPKVNHLTVADLDHDGDADLAVGISIFRDATPYKIPILRVFRNDVGQDANFTAIRLRGRGAGGANRSGIGAVIEVTAQGKTQIVTMDGGFGLGIQNDLTAIAGLGAACAIDKVKVYWPDAAHSVTELKDVRANYTIEISQDEPTLRYITK